MFNTKINFNKILDVKIDLKFFNQLFLLLYAMFYTLTFAANISKGIILYTILFCWLVTAIFIDCKWLEKSKMLILCFVVYFILLLTRALVTGSFGVLDIFFRNNIYFFAWIVIGVFYSHNIDKINLKTVLTIVIGFLFISYLATIVGLLQYPTASRDLASSGIHMSNPLYMSLGIGGFAYIYQIPYLIIAAIGTIGFKSKQGKNISFMTLLLLVIIVVLLADYTTALIISAGSFMLAVIFKGDKHIANKLIIVGVGLIIVLIFRVELLTFIVDVFFPDTSSVFRRRLLELIDAMSVDGVGSLDRFTMMENSISAFLNNPFFGTLFTESVSGGHSDIVDALGSYGMFSIFYYGIFEVAAYYQYKQLKMKSNKVSFILIHFIFIFARITNPALASASIACTMYFICPTILYFNENRYSKQQLIKEQEQEKL